jgi:hypothetical protein
MKESNLLNCYGVMPANQDEFIPVRSTFNGGTEVKKFGSATDTTTVIHTVTTTKTFRLTEFSFTAVAGAIGFASLSVYDGTPTWLYNLVYFGFISADRDSVALSFTEPVIIPADYSVRIISNHADIDCHAFIHGYEK